MLVSRFLNDYVVVWNTNESKYTSVMAYWVGNLGGSWKKFYVLTTFLYICINDYFRINIFKKLYYILKQLESEILKYPLQYDF